jgi:uncharacterized protein YhaN
MFLWGDTTEPTTLYGVLALIIAGVPGLLSLVLSYFYRRGRDIATKQKNEAVAERDAVAEKYDAAQRAVNEAFAEWKGLVAELKAERDTLREDYRQKSIELMNKMVRITELEGRVQQLERELAAFRHGESK